jgi:hypothetical protein
MKKNGYKIRICPFKNIGFSMYSESDLQITEKLEQAEDSFKYTSSVECENLEINVGFVYDILESPK